MHRKLIAGNWKMNGLRATAACLAGDLARRAAEAGPLPYDLLVCPPAQLLLPVAEILAGGPVALGAQDCHAARSGAHTGDISAEMLEDIGCAFVIVGHSERRANYGETDAQVQAKAVAGRDAGLVPIVCVGETEAQREGGETLAVIGRQIEGSLPQDGSADGLVVAYEPVWAIGTGRTATPRDVADVHAHIRGLLTDRFGVGEGGEIRILYGGSVKPDNAAELLSVADVDGALVGGASLEAASFWAIGASCP